MDNNAGSNEKQKDIMEKSGADSSEQQYASIDDGNANKSSADINISETTAVDRDIGSNNKSDDKTINDTWSKDDPIIKIFSFNTNASLKFLIQNKNSFFYLKLLVWDEFLGEIVQSSNEYARPVIDSNRPLRYKSILNKWNEVTLPEIKKFFGLVFHMALVGTPSVYCVIMCTVVQVSPLQK